MITIAIERNGGYSVNRGTSAQALEELILYKLELGGIISELLPNRVVVRTSTNNVVGITSFNGDESEMRALVLYCTAYLHLATGLAPTVTTLALEYYFRTSGRNTGRQVIMNPDPCWTEAGNDILTVLYTLLGITREQASGYDMEDLIAVYDLAIQTDKPASELLALANKEES